MDVKKSLESQTPIERVVQQALDTPGGDASSAADYKVQLEAVDHISHALFQSVDLDELIETTLKTALKEVDAEAGSILLANPEKAELVFQYSIGEKPVPRGTGHPLEQRDLRIGLSIGRARITDHVNQEIQHLRTIDQSIGLVTRDMVTVPLRRWREGGGQSAC